MFQSQGRPFLERLLQHFDQFFQNLANCEIGLGGWLPEISSDGRDATPFRALRT